MLSMTDNELFTSFENCSLPYDDWTHLAHVRVAFLYASRNYLDAAIDLMRASVKRYNAATNTPEAIDRGYHETITLALMRLIYSPVTRKRQLRTETALGSAQVSRQWFRAHLGDYRYR